ncbi:MAG: TPM domain-containing protein [Chthoniobacterales bacterium]|nr:TPM domain-containing protein [Chthoniobacterales bacterium]
MRTKEFLSRLDNDRIVRAIGAAEALTSGEIRVYLKRGEIDDTLKAAREQFEKLGMTATRERNGVLIFVAPRSQKFAVIGDEGIHQRCGESFWQQLVEGMQNFFKAENFTDAVVHAIQRTGELLAQEFPRQPDDRDELPNAVETG